jgi:hypothetical protein
MLPLENSLTNQNLFHTITICIPCFLLVESIALLSLKAARDALGIIGRQLMSQFALFKATEEIRQCWYDEICMYLHHQPS